MAQWSSPFGLRFALPRGTAGPPGTSGTDPRPGVRKPESPARRAEACPTPYRAMAGSAVTIYEALAPGLRHQPCGRTGRCDGEAVDVPRRRRV